MVEKRKLGFTLIELIAVIAVLGLLSVIIVPNVIKTMEKARKNSFLNSAYGLVRAANLAQRCMCLMMISKEWNFITTMVLKHQI